MKPVLVTTRFWSKVKKTKSCWYWLAGKTSKGYGDFWLNRKHKLAHRFSYEQLVGEIPQGLTLDHLCRNRGCVNPNHLEPVTKGENVLRGVGITANNVKKTHCPQGHEYSGKNLYIQPDGRRVCKECNRNKAKRWYQKNISRCREYGRKYSRLYYQKIKNKGEK